MLWATVENACLEVKYSLLALRPPGYQLSQKDTEENLPTKST